MCHTPAPFLKTVSGVCGNGSLWGGKGSPRGGEGSIKAAPGMAKVQSTCLAGKRELRSQASCGVKRQLLPVMSPYTSRGTFTCVSIAAQSACGGRGKGEGRGGALTVCMQGIILLPAGVRLHINVHCTANLQVLLAD